MTSKTRRLVMCFLSLAGVMVAAELLLLGSTASPRDIPAMWASRLTVQDRANAAARIAEFPTEYRRALLSTLPPADRAKVWSATINNYVVSHPELISEHRQLLTRAAGMATATIFETGEGKSELLTLKNQIEHALGGAAVRELLVTPGPVLDSTSMARLPLRVQLEAFARSLYVVEASLDCNCYRLWPLDCPMDFFCSEIQGCDFSHFGCGIWGLEPCSGYCIPNPE